MDDTAWVSTWTENASAFDRVRSVVMAVDEARSAGWVAEHARVAESTARDHLDRLHEMGVVTARDAGETRYRPDPAYVRFREIRELAAAHDTEELSQFVLELREAIDEIRDEHDGGSPAELRAAAAGDDVSTERARERLRAADDWEHYAYRLSLIEDALARYDEFRTDSPAPA